MRRVSLIGTVHEESDGASIAELQAILERSQPEVIFAEIPSANVDHYKDRSHGNLESNAVARYLANHHVAVVPVDLPEPGPKFFDDAKDMFAKIERTSPAYRRMVDCRSADIRAGGFVYLNSERYIRASLDIDREVRATIEWIGDSRLREIWFLWDQTHERRDREMVKNIANYCARSTFARGVFLVGAAHRTSIIDKGLAIDGTGVPRIEWDLDGFLKDAG